MVKFRTIVGFARYFTDSKLTLEFNSLCSMDFLTFDVAPKLPGWDLAKLTYYAEYDNMIYVWADEKSPKDFSGSWTFLERTDA